MSQSKNSPFRIAVMLSGRGSNFAALREHIVRENLPIEIVLVLSDQPEAAGLARAKGWGLNTAVVRRLPKERSNAEFNVDLARAVARAKPDLVVLAGFMRILTTEFISEFRGRAINIHPSLLPAFRGLHAQRQAIEAGVKLSGCTVHVALEELDAGPILAQAEVPVLADDTEESLAARILKEEHRILPAVVRDIAEGKIRINVDANGDVSVQFPKEEK